MRVRVVRGDKPYWYVRVQLAFTEDEVGGHLFEAHNGFSKLLKLVGNHAHGFKVVEKEGDTFLMWYLNIDENEKEVIEKWVRQMKLEYAHYLQDVTGAEVTFNE